MYGDDLTWRLESIHAEVSNLVMFAAAWPSMTNDQRQQVRMRWGGVVRMISDMRWDWRRLARGEDNPAWWQELRETILEHQQLIDYMDLDMPDLSPVERWVLRWVRVSDSDPVE